MNNYNIIAVNFKGSAPEYETLTMGFSRSVKKNANADLYLLTPWVPPKVKGCRFSYTVTNAKLNVWNEFAQLISRPTILMDVDLIVRQDLGHVFDLDHDAVFTTNGTKNTWINSGVVFLKPTARAKDLMQRWTDADNELYQTKIMNGMPKGVRKGHRDTGVLGMNQTSFAVIEKELDYGTIPCSKYNCWNDTWREWNPKQTAVVHVQMGLRKALTQNLAGEDSKRRYDNILRDILPYYL